MANFCQNCGAAVEEKAAFCPACGCPLDGVTTYDSMAAEQPVDYTAQDYAAQPIQTTDNTASTMAAAAAGALGTLVAVNLIGGATRQLYYYGGRYYMDPYCRTPFGTPHMIMGRHRVLPMRPPMRPMGPPPRPMMGPPPRPMGGPGPRPMGPAPRPMGPAPRPMGPAPRPMGPVGGLGAKLGGAMGSKFGGGKRGGHR